MKLGIMQPYFFPYIGYFQLIAAVDKYVFFDTPQYERRGWMNRNRIINLKNGFTYITVPIVKAPQNTSLYDVRIDNSREWRKTILSQLEVYKKRAQYYDRTIALIKAILNDSPDSLSELNIFSVLRICDYVGFSIDYDVFSKMNIEVSTDCEPDEWALKITKVMGYDTYINAPGGQSFFDCSKYSEAGINLRFIQPRITPYVQKLGRFESGLSIIDVLMFNEKDDVIKMINDYGMIKLKQEMK